MRNSKLSSRTFPVLAIAAASLMLNSCSDSEEGVRVYEVIVPENSQNQGASAPSAPSRPAAPSNPGTPAPNSQTLSWTAPESWKQIPNANRFDRARYEVGGNDEQKAVATVTAGIGGSVPMNVNRWRGQLGLGPATEDQLKAAAIPVETPGSKGVIFELSSADGSRKILAAILPVPGDTYFFKLDGPAATVDAERDAFMELVNSSKIDKPGSTPSASPKTSSAAQKPRLKFDTPSGWKTGSEDSGSSMRTASYTTSNGGEVSILLFRASPDAILQNVNIWRQEAGLDDATSEDQLELTEVKSSNGELTWNIHQVIGDQLAVLAAFATVDDTLWVVRLKSTPSKISEDSAAMVEFLQSASSK